jgi:hypothetical protein
MRLVACVRGLGGTASSIETLERLSQGRPKRLRNAKGGLEVGAPPNDYSLPVDAAVQVSSVPILQRHVFHAFKCVFCQVIKAVNDSAPVQEHQTKMWPAQLPLQERTSIL